MSNGNKRTYLREVNPHLICPLCRGYLIDATTVVECLHSFCRSCILKHLRKDAKCPSCKLLLNTAKPNIKADKTLQDIVYKLVPGLYHKEMRRRRDYYSNNPKHAELASPEQRGEDVSGRLIFAPEDFISLSLEHLPVGADPLTLLSNNNNNNDTETSQAIDETQHKQQNVNGNAVNRRYLRCPALVTIALLKKFLALKYSVDVTRFNIDIYHRRAPLPEHWTLMDVAYIFAWKRNAPIRFFYRVTDEQQLEAPPNARPSTPGLGATQPPTDEQIHSSDAKQTELDLQDGKTINKSSTDDVSIPRESQVKTPSPQKRVEGEFLAKRSAPSPKEKEKPAPPIKSQESIKQVKTPIKILKNSDGHYQVLRSSSLPTQKSPTTTKSSPPPATPEFSVVSIDDAKSNGVKITLKQCTPSNNNSKKPKVISNVLLRNPNDKSNNDDKQRRKVNSGETTSPTKQSKKQTENSDKRQFLQGFRLKAAPQQETSKPDDADSVEAQVRNIIQKSMMNRGMKATGEESPKKNEDSPCRNDDSPKKNEELSKKKDESPKKQTSELNKSASTNIADRLNDSKKLANAPETLAASSTDETQQPIDVYAFPNDPPTTVLPGAVKRKCPPGLPLFDSRKKQQHYTLGKRTGVHSARGGAVKCYRNQTKAIYPKPPPPPSPARPLQSMSNPIGNLANVNANSTSPNPVVSSTSSRNTSTSPSVLISNDTRSLLDGCGLNIPASLSITLTASKSPSPSLQSDSRDVKDSQNNLEKLNPSITLNDKSVDTKVLKALKSGQIRMPLASAKTQDRKLPEGPPAKRKKDEISTPVPSQQPRNALDLSGSKKAEIQIRIPTPLGKFKSKPNWPGGNIPIKPKEDPASFGANGQVVTLNGGQRFYRAPPGSLTPAVHRVGDIPTPTRAPVYAPCFSSPILKDPRQANHNLSSVFPSLQSLYALSQAPSLEQFHNMDSRMRLTATAAATATGKKDISPSSQVGNKSHIAAQCAPIKPARSPHSPFAVPLAKQNNHGLTIKPVTSKPNTVSNNSKMAASTAVDSDITASSTNSNVLEDKDKKKSNDKDVPANLDSEISETCASTTEESNSQQGAASPRVTSTASPPPPPPSTGEATAKTDVEKPSESEKNQSSEQVTSSNNKSPESPDSSSVVTEGIDLVDSTKSAKSRETSPVKITETMKDEIDSDKKNEKDDDAKFKKPMTSETLQKRFLAAFPSNEWANNPVAAEQFGNFLKSLSSMQTEAQSKNPEAVE